MIPGFEDGILGHKAGDEFDIHVTFPERYHAKDLAGKAVVFKIKLHDVCVRQLPSMNSDFAKKVGAWTPWRSSARRCASSCTTAVTAVH